MISVVHGKRELGINVCVALLQTHVAGAGAQMEILEIKETLIAVELNNANCSANCTVLTEQITLAKLGLTKLHLN